ncbi:MAG: hypothetical protein LBO03_00510 [Acidaminococcales bacterium]|jgi:hypothetical protein|nr:hypothetical protein [Acidaminococcales bacterium]
MVRRNKIIYCPNKISKYRHGLEFAIKLFLSAAVFFLTLSLWGYFGSYFYRGLFSESYFANTVEILGKLLVAALFVFFAMFFWQQYNILAFGGRTRRRVRPPNASILYCCQKNMAKKTKSAATSSLPNISTVFAK